MPDPHAGFVVRDFKPAYLTPGRLPEMRHRAAAAEEQLRDCHICPRACAVDRTRDELGTCLIGHQAQIASAFPHLGEEDVLRGSRGSGTIFFAGCNLGCDFCQNADISRCNAERPVTPGDLARVMLGLQDVGCHNINFVTPSHVVPQIIAALIPAIETGLRLPLVYNTSAYDTVDTLRWLDGLVDIYMPDFKFATSSPGARYLNAPDYAEVARAAVSEMHRQVGDLQVDSAGRACRGVLVRHLVVPDHVAESAAIFQWLSEHISRDTFINIMGQYRPAHRVCPTRHPELNRPVTTSEMQQAYDSARTAGLWRFD